MKYYIFLQVALILCQPIFSQYDINYVQKSIINISNESYAYIAMSRDNNRIKAKYFASRDFNGNSVYKRFNEWARNKKIIAVTSGTYMTNWDPATAQPVGLCIDNGVVVNEGIILNKLDGLAIVYPSAGGGGIAVTNLKNGNCTISDERGTRNVNIRDSWDRDSFVDWARQNSATVFQSHLFVYNNKIIFDPNKSSNVTAMRRFLAVGKNSENETVHYIINLSSDNTLFNAAKKVHTFLNQREQMNIIFMINLDTGGQNAFQVYNSNGSIDTRKDFTGTTPLSGAVNLLVYYFE